MPEEEKRSPLSPEEAREKLQAMNAIIFFEKSLTNSDASGRIVIPKSVAETSFPPLEEQVGTQMTFTDVYGRKHTARFRFWTNAQSRMYLLESTQAMLQAMNLTIGNVIMFAKKTDGSYMTCGRTGTKDDIARRPPGSRKSVAKSFTKSIKRSPAPTATGKVVTERRSKRSKAKAESERKNGACAGAGGDRGAAAGIKSNSFWAALSLPARTDGVFRALPNPEGYKGLTKGKVEPQHGCWTAIVSLGGELYQAFFDNQDAAQAAFDAAAQNNEGLETSNAAEAV